jgi:hypothetical protein
VSRYEVILVIALTVCEKISSFRWCGAANPIRGDHKYKRWRIHVVSLRLKMIQANRYDHEEFSRKIWGEGRDFNDHDALAHNNFLGTRKRFQAVAVALDKLRAVRHPSS